MPPRTPRLANASTTGAAARGSRKVNSLKKLSFTRPTPGMAESRSAVATAAAWLRRASRVSPASPSSARWIVKASAHSPELVQMLLVAFSRRICCSRVESVSTQRRIIADLAVEIRVLDDNARSLAVDERGEVLAAARRGVLNPQLLAGKPRIGLADPAIVRVQPARQHRLAAAGEAAGHRHRLGAGGGAVIERGVGDLHRGQQGDLGLELEQVLQRALRQLRLVGGVGGQELTALDQMVDRRRDVMAIAAAAEKERHGAGAKVLGRHRAEAPLDLELAHRQRQIEQALMARRNRHIGKQRVDRWGADRREHRLAVGIGQRQIAHHSCSATKASYAALSISESSSLGSARRSFKNQPSPIASAFTLAGSPTIAALTATTSPETGA